MHHMDLLGIRHAADLDRAFSLVQILLHISILRQIYERICKNFSHGSSCFLLLFFFAVMIIHRLRDPHVHDLADCISRFLHRISHRRLFFF